MADPIPTPDPKAQPEQKRADLAAQHSLALEKVHRLAIKDGAFEVFVRSPGRAQWKRFTQVSSAPEKRAEALEQLVRDCLLSPDRHAFEVMLDDRPALGVVLGAELADIAGAGLEVEKNV